MPTLSQITQHLTVFFKHFYVEQIHLKLPLLPRMSQVMLIQWQDRMGICSLVFDLRNYLISRIFASLRLELFRLDPRMAQ